MTRYSSVVIPDCKFSASLQNSLRRVHPCYDAGSSHRLENAAYRGRDGRTSIAGSLACASQQACSCIGSLSAGASRRPGRTHQPACTNALRPITTLSRRGSCFRWAGHVAWRCASKRSARWSQLNERYRPRIALVMERCAGRRRRSDSVSRTARHYAHAAAAWA